MGNALDRLEAMMRAAQRLRPDEDMLFSARGELPEDVYEYGRAVLALAPHLLGLWAVCEQPRRDVYPSVQNALKALNEAAFKELADDPA